MVKSTYGLMLDAPPMPAIKPKRMYLAGPMTGQIHLDDFFEFNSAAAAKLRARGLVVTNPAELLISPESTWSNAMRVEIRELMCCDGVAFLQNWKNCRGAYLLCQIAITLGFSLFFLDANGDMQPEDLPRIEALQWSKFI